MQKYFQGDTRDATFVRSSAGEHYDALERPLCQCDALVQGCNDVASEWCKVR